MLKAIDYIHENPVRRGFCKRAVDWPWSSARHYHAADPVPHIKLPTIHSLPPPFLDR